MRLELERKDLKPEFVSFGVDKIKPEHFSEEAQAALKICKSGIFFYNKDPIFGGAYRKISPDE